MADEVNGPGASAVGAGRRQERASREAAALRANLLKRKAQRRGREDATAAPSAEGRGDAEDGVPGDGTDRKATFKAG